ncbi:NUDIX domain-containing protein [Roseibium album]|uniref:NUDIX domain-containing protein n=1 Tax=Roseibium album TaxID=311410 RepID=UPI0024913EB6|nr:NUDIX domain-containing protein [Roseibium album]
MLKLLSILPTSWTKRIVQSAVLLRNPYILGVRVIVENEKKQVLLVRHTYLEGWYLPGGAVDGGETLDKAAAREVMEEAGVIAAETPRLLGMYLNREATGRDHVGLFHLREWSKADSFLDPNTEIAEAGFFAPDALPDTLSPATGRRLDEFRTGSYPAGAFW